MYKSYHVQFIESHGAIDSTPTLDPIDGTISLKTPIIHTPSAIDEIFQTASTEPLLYNEDEEEYLPPNQTLNPDHN
jgi:hypothetical protein